MTAWIIAAAGVLTLAAAVFVPVHLKAACQNGAFTLTARAGFVPVKLFPGERTAAAETEAERGSVFRRLSPEMLRLLADCGCRAAGRLLSRSRVSTLYARYTAGGPDPYRAVMAYARAGIVMEGAARLVPDADLRADVDLTGGRTRFTGELTVSARGWTVLRAAGCFGMAFLRGYFQYQREKEG